MRTPLPVSVVLITLNAAATLSATLESVRGWVSEIIVLDAGSQDDTVAMATCAGARVIHQPWLGFGPQKQAAVAAARYDWVLCLDADECISAALAASLQQLFPQPKAYVYRLARCNRFLGRWLKHGEGYPDWCVRFFHRQYAHWSDDAVHEKVVTTQPAISLSGDLYHYSAESLHSYLQKQNQYTSLQAQALVKTGKKITPFTLLLSPLLRFIKFYIFKQGWRDGAAGLIHILIGCFNSFCKYAKVLAIQREQSP